MQPALQHRILLPEALQRLAGIARILRRTQQVPAVVGICIYQKNSV